MKDADLKRRLAAIVAADVAGYTRLMEQDTDGTVAAWKSARDGVIEPTIGEFTGRIIKFTGDGFLAEFSSVHDAVACALRLQRRLSSSPLRFRVGVNLGDITDDGKDVHGEGVNIAARLEALAEPGGICISGDVHNQVKNRIEAAYADMGEQQVKHVSQPVRAYRVSDANAPVPGSARSVAGIDLSLPDRPSVAVLPLTNMSGDPEQEYFTDGMTEDIITELSRFHSLFVIARNSTFSYKGKSVDVRTVARELGVRYVLEGSVRKAANRIRVTVQLVDSLSGNHIWADRYDRVLEDVFEVQEEVTRAIVTAIAPQINAAEWERARRRRPENLSAYDIAMRANADVWTAFTRSDEALREQAASEARRALELDPRSGPALFVLGLASMQSLAYRNAADPQATFTEGMAAVTKAIEVDPSNADAYAIRAWLLQLNPDGLRRWDEALFNARRAAELNPNSMLALSSVGRITGYCGDWARSVELLQAALRVSPLDPLACYHYQGLALASLCTGRYDDGAEYARRGIHVAPDYVNVFGLLAMNLVGLGEIEEARAACETVRRLSPAFLEQRLRDHSFFRRPEDDSRCTTFLRIAAGLDDPGAADALR